MATIAVRRAVAEDAKLVSSLNADVQALHAAAMPHFFKPPGPDTFPEAAAADVLARPSARVFIAEVGEEPVGYAFAEINRSAGTALRHPREVMHLHHLSVRRQFRRCGVGKALIDAVRAAGASEGVRQMTLDVWKFNEEARAFFRRQGFSVYNERMWDLPAGA